MPDLTLPVNIATDQVEAWNAEACCRFRIRSLLRIRGWRRFFGMVRPGVERFVTELPDESAWQSALRKV